MTDWLLALVPTYGLWLLAAATFLSCLAIPIPASILMLAAGGFVAAGDLPLLGTLAAAVVGATLGDQFGFLAGRRGGARLLAWLGSRAAPVEKARALLERRGSVAVFFSRWLVSALGPYVNVAAGAAGLSWARFTLWGVLGEAVWTGLYVGLGYAFTGNLAAASDLAWTILGFAGAAAVAIGLGYWLFTILRQDGKTRAG